MTPEKFEQANKVFSKPEGWTEDQCGDLPVWAGSDQSGHPCIISKWVPSKEELAALNAGEGIYLMIAGTGMPPVSLFTGSPFVENPATYPMGAA